MSHIFYINVDRNSDKLPKMDGLTEKRLDVEWCMENLLEK